MIRIEIIASKDGIYCVSKDWVILKWFDSWDAAKSFRDSLIGGEQ